MVISTSEKKNQHGESAQQVHDQSPHLWPLTRSVPWTILIAIDHKTSIEPDQAAHLRSLARLYIVCYLQFSTPDNAVFLPP